MGNRAARSRARMIVRPKSALWSACHPAIGRTIIRAGTSPGPAGRRQERQLPFRRAPSQEPAPGLCRGGGYSPRRGRLVVRRPDRGEGHCGQNAHNRSVQFVYRKRRWPPT